MTLFPYTTLFRSNHYKYDYQNNKNLIHEGNLGDNGEIITSKQLIFNTKEHLQMELI